MKCRTVIHDGSIESCFRYPLRIFFISIGFSRLHPGIESKKNIAVLEKDLFSFSQIFYNVYDVSMPPRIKPFFIKEDSCPSPFSS